LFLCHQKGENFALNNKKPFTMGKMFSLHHHSVAGSVNRKCGNIREQSFQKSSTRADRHAQTKINGTVFASE
jgi:hypothetical protein